MVTTEKEVTVTLYVTAPIANVQDVSIETLCSLHLTREVVRQVSL